MSPETQGAPGRQGSCAGWFRELLEEGRPVVAAPMCLLLLCRSSCKLELLNPEDQESCGDSNFQKVKAGMEVILQPGVGGDKELEH